MICLAVGLLSPALAGAALSKHVVLVDWDGFEPALLSRGYALPNLNSLAKSGSLSTAQSTYTTFSNPARGSMSTGAYPERHGNVAWVFDPTANLVIGQTRDLAAETIAEALARAPGRTFASVQWYMVQNRGAAYGDPAHLYVQPGGDFGNRVNVAIDILFRRPVNSGGQLVTVPKVPDMLAVYGPDPDEISHAEGTQSPNMRAVMEQQDRDLGRLIQATRDVGTYKSTTFVLTGDHGMTDWNRSALSVLSQAVTEAGYVPEVLYAGDSPQNPESNVIIAPAVRVAYLTLRGGLAGNSAARDRVRAALAAHTEIESVLGSTELAGLHAGPKLGDLVAEARPPWSFAKADLPPGALKAAHGSRAELDVPLYLAGAGVRKTKPSQPQIVDVAPTISALLGVPCPAQAQGRPLNEAFTSPAKCP